jgi:hypothetical protein
MIGPTNVTAESGVYKKIVRHTSRVPDDRACDSFRILP